MKKIVIISIIVGAFALVGAFAGGWYSSSKSQQKEQSKVSTLNNEFMYQLFSHKNDKAYGMMTDGYKEANTQEEFNSTVALLNNQELEPGITSVYKNGSSYMITQEYINKDGKVSNVAVVNVAKVDKEYKVTNVSAN